MAVKKPDPRLYELATCERILIDRRTRIQTWREEIARAELMIREHLESCQHVNRRIYELESQLK